MVVTDISDENNLIVCYQYISYFNTTPRKSMAVLTNVSDADSYFSGM